jgi:hypothetical protein
MNFWQRFAIFLQIEAMNLKELLDLHRAHYIDHFVQGLQKLEDSPTEILLDLDNKAPDELHRMYRVDGLKLVGDSYRMVEFNLTSPFKHAPFTEQRGEVTVEVHPFIWNACVVEVLTDRIDRGAVIAWGTHWIDVEDVKSKDADGMQGVIHNISPASYPQGKLTYWVDFGTAPVQAMLELIKVLTIGAKSAKVTLR